MLERFSSSPLQSVKMPRKALKLCVELTVNRVSCPGVWLRSNNEVYLSVCLFGKYQRTTLCEPVFPVIVMEKFRFDKTFYTAIDPAEVSDLLEDEDVLFEFVQLAPEEPDGAVLLASFQRNVRDFLYPYPQLLPSYGAADREILMDKSWDFPGIAPRMEFGSHAKIKEVKIPNPHRKSHRNDMSDALRSSRSQNRSPSPRSFLYPDSEEDYKGYQDPTVSSIVRSRSLSPAMKTKLRDSASKIRSDRPNFAVRRNDERLMHRVPGSSNSNSRRRTKSAVLRPSSPAYRPCSKLSRSMDPEPFYSDEESDVEYLGSSAPRRTTRYLAAQELEDELRRQRIERAERVLNSSLGSYRPRSMDKLS